MKTKVKSEAKKRLAKIISGDESSAKARLANLRHGIGLAPGDNPSLWGMIFDDLPEEMLGKYGKPSKQEWAIYDALTLYALHQQGKNPLTSNMNEENVSLGKAAAKLVYLEGGTDDDRERISRRFNQIALSSDINSLTYYLRTFIPMLRDKDIKLDYPLLAQDIFEYQTESGKSRVRLKWGQDYYSKANNEEE